MSHYAMTIGGKPVTTTKTFNVLNPADETVVAACPEGTTALVDEAVSSARRAFPSWAALPDSERVAKLLAIADLIEKHHQELSELVTREQGKTQSGPGANLEVGGAVAWTRVTAGLSLAEETIQDDKSGKIVLRRKPVGVVASITPWNWPLMIAVWHIIPAILAGNTIVLKPSPLTPLSTLRLGELINELLPAGVVNIIAGGGEVGARLASHPGIAKIALTGSTETGRKVLRSAADNLARVTLELGGNDAGIVLPGTDIAPLVEGIFWGAFINDGQTCGALKRLYVPQRMAGEIAEALAVYASNVPMGDGLDESNVLGPLQNQAQFDKVTEYVKEALAKGAQALSGGVPSQGVGYFYPPTILAGCTDDMRVVSEEQFGPVLPVIGYNEVEDAIAFGGIKCSGMGVMFGEMGLKEFTTLQVVMS